MPSTADEMVAAARVNFGRAKDERATHLMEQWLDAGCREWRRESGEGVADGETVVSAVFAVPIKAYNLRMQVAQNVKRWGFVRRGHQKANLKFITIDDYMTGPTGELAQRRAREIIQRGVKRHKEVVRARKLRRQQNLEAVEKRLRSAAVPELRLVLKGLWNNAAEASAARKVNNGWLSCREDPIAKRRRLTRGLNFDEKENYTDEGEPIWEKLDAARRK
jgi:hypothetical protein